MTVHLISTGMGDREVERALRSLYAVYHGNGSIVSHSIAHSNLDIIAEAICERPHAIFWGFDLNSRVDFLREYQGIEELIIWQPLPIVRRECEEVVAKTCRVSKAKIIFVGSKKASRSTWSDALFIESFDILADRMIWVPDLDLDCTRFTREADGLEYDTLVFSIADRGTMYKIKELLEVISCQLDFKT